MPISLSDDWLENGPTEDAREFDEETGEEIEPEICDSCGKRVINDYCACAGDGDY